MKGAARIAVVCAALVGAGRVIAQQQPGFWLTGIPPGLTSGTAKALSRDGGVAVGSNANFATFQIPGFRWTRAGGRYDFGLEPGMPPETSASGVNSDGSVLAGTMVGFTPSDFELAYRRVGNSPLESLGVLPNETRSYSNGISGDAGIIVGGCEHGSIGQSLGQAFRWTEQGGMQGLGYARPGNTYSDALAISRDGSTIVGLSLNFGSGDQDAFVWRQGIGMQALSGLPGALFVGNDARAVNADGSMIVGSASNPQGQSRAVLWTSAGIQNLGILPGYFHSTALAIDDSGGVIGGVLQDQSESAFVWTPEGGMRLLSDYLASYGVAVPAGYRLYSLNAISGDGLTFGGQAFNLTNQTWEGFVATVPAPGSLLLIVAPALLLRRRRAA